MAVAKSVLRQGRPPPRPSPVRTGEGQALPSCEFRFAGRVGEGAFWPSSDFATAIFYWRVTQCRFLFPLLLMVLLTSCSHSTPPTRAERITAALLQIDDVPVGWLQTSDVMISAKPACDGDAYWRTFRPEHEAGRFHRLQQVIFDCSDSAGADAHVLGHDPPDGALGAALREFRHATPRPCR